MYVKFYQCTTRVFADAGGFKVRPLMYAFGDDPNPAPDTVNVMEEIVIEYIQQLVGTYLCLLLFTILQSSEDTVRCCDPAT